MEELSKLKKEMCDIYFNIHSGITLNKENKTYILKYSESMYKLISSIPNILNLDYSIMDKAYEDKSVRKTINYLYKKSIKNVIKYNGKNITEFLINCNIKMLLNCIIENNYNSPIDNFLHMTTSKVNELITNIKKYNNGTNIGKQILLINLYLSDIHYLLEISKHYFNNNKLTDFYTLVITEIESLIYVTDTMLERCVESERGC